MRKQRLLVAGLSALALTVSLSACGPDGGAGQSADGYPTKNIELVVGFAAGGHNDSVARRFAEGLGDELGQRVLVVNREGGGGAIATTEAKNASADGYTLLFAPTGAFTSTMLQQSVSYEIEDFRSITPVAENTFVVAVPASSPYETFDDLLEAEGRLTFSAFGEGHNTHLIAEKIADEYDLEAELVSFNGSPPALQAIVNGDVDFGIQDVTSALPRMESGEVRALAVTTDYVPERVEEVSPGLPSIADYDLEEALFAGSQALAIQKDAPDELVDTLREASENVTESEDFVQFITDSGGAVPDVDGEEWFSDYMPYELERFRTLYEQLGIPTAE
ncbi:MAG: Bug family tripartite tricarboxylate transporter substrate binding protein [Micrococcaceae bacterium]